MRAVTAACIILPHVSYVFLTGGLVPTYYAALGTVVVGIGYSFLREQMRVSWQAAACFFLLAVVPLVWFLLQGLWLSDVQVVIRGINYSLFVISGMYLARIARPEQVFSILRWFVVFNLAGIAVWLLWGRLVPLNMFDRSDYGYVLELFGVLQRVAADDYTLRFAGFTHNANTLALWGALGFCGLAAVKVTGRQYLLWTIVALVVLGLTQSRIGLLTAAVFYLLFTVLNRQVSGVRRVLTAGGLLSVILVALTLVYFVRGPVQGDWSSGRLDDVQILTAIIARHDEQLYFGVGLGNIVTVVANNYATKRSVDGSYLVSLVENGVVGTSIIYGTFLVATIGSLAVSYRTSYERFRFSVSLLGALLIFGIFETGICRNSFVHTLWVALTFYGLSREEELI